MSKRGGKSSSVKRGPRTNPDGTTNYAGSYTYKAAGATGKWVDDRIGGAPWLRKNLNKVFPDHWSFMLGEVAMYSFIILLLTGTYLTLFFEASLSEVVYEGSYAPLRGVRMTEAYESTLNISFDVRGGLIIRQIHHWAALMFMVSIVMHLLRVFFTGAFRKPREINWLIGVGLLVLGILEGFAGYSLPDDLLSGTGMRIAFSILLSIPVVGTYAAYLLFGGEYPGTVIEERLYVAHILLIPGILLALITVHVMLVWYQKHTQFRGPGRTEHNVIGTRFYPIYMAKAGGFFFLVFAVITALAAFAQINPIWLYGPYEPYDVSAGSQPDWYMMFLDGSTRLFPNWEFRGFGVTLSPLFWPTVVFPGIVFTGMALYPFLEAKFTGDRAPHNLLDRPRDKPVRTAIGVMSITFYLVLLVSGGNDIVAQQFNISLNAMTWGGRIACLVLPPLAYWFTYRMCLGLQRSDQEKLHHGIETGIITRSPEGRYAEITAPLPEPARIALMPVEPPQPPGAPSGNGGSGGGLGRPGNRIAQLAGSKARGFFYRQQSETKPADSSGDQLTGSGSGSGGSGQQ